MTAFAPALGGDRARRSPRPVRAARTSRGVRRLLVHRQLADGREDDDEDPIDFGGEIAHYPNWNPYQSGSRATLDPRAVEAAGWAMEDVQHALARFQDAGAAYYRARVEAMAGTATLDLQTICARAGGPVVHLIWEWRGARFHVDLKPGSTLSTWDCLPLGNQLDLFRAGWHRDTLNAALRRMVRARLRDRGGRAYVRVEMVDALRRLEHYRRRRGGRVTRRERKGQRKPAAGAVLTRLGLDIRGRRHVMVFGIRHGRLALLDDGGALAADPATAAAQAKAMFARIGAHQEAPP